MRTEPDAIAERLAEARARTLLLIAPVSGDDLRRQHDPLMGPILWDLGHIAHFEALWLLDNLRGEIRFSEMPGLYNPFEHPRSVRGDLELPSLSATLDAMNEIRGRVFAALEQIDFDTDSPLLRDAYVYSMVLQHEYQHDETILQTLQLKGGEPYRAPRGAPTPPVAIELEPGAMVRFPGGRIDIGTDDRTVAYDNERPVHRVTLPSFWIDAAPVTNSEYLAFIEDGGYRRDDVWSEAGGAWRDREGLVAPKYWTRENGTWRVRRYDRTTDADNRHPVCHVCWYEAEAFARWAGKRLPTELEWEAAASWDPFSGRARSWPWGDEPPSPLHANLDQLAFDTTPVGSFARNISPIGCYGMIGDVWEWTASDFTGWPGFEPYPYPEYSEAFFGSEYKVLRGGAWATRHGAIRNTFRNWDYPIRRQIFSGFRCARDD